MRFLPHAVSLLTTFAVFVSSAAAVPNPVIITGDPVAPSPAIPGTGLCGTSAISTSPANDFGNLNPQTYNAGINAFIEMHSQDRVTSTLQTIFDLSNNNDNGSMIKPSYGDFTDAMTPLCKTGGCDFPWNDTTTSFASRYRGFVEIPQSLTGKPVHFGFYADDAVSLTIYDKGQTAYPVVTRPPVLGAATWRTTNSVTFMKAGLYAIEINYVEIVEHAALEMSLLDGTFSDFELPVTQQGSTNLKQAGFQLVLPASFYQTDDGQPPFVDLAKCAQCNRQFANLPGNGGCGPGLYCNEAALCAPCNSALFCGASCSPCGGSTPFCVNGNKGNLCVGCRDDKDCKTGLRCDPDLHVCQDCNRDDDCERGKICNAHKCVPCATVEHCAGASCNCCPQMSKDGKMQCAALTKDGPPVCVECLSDKDCAGKRCDTINGRCVDAVPQCNTPDKCGPGCVRCPSDRPLCLDGQVCVECRADTDCGAGNFCLSGECSPCAIDRHCGTRCASCGGDAPVCLTSDGTAAHSGCVRCLHDSQCPGGICDSSTHNCKSPGCGMTCAMGTLCDGKRCVTCYANTHCPCGGSCDVPSGTCAVTCSDSSDCSSTGHCTADQKTCQPGRKKPNTMPEGSGPCSCLSRIGGARACTGAGQMNGLLILISLGAMAMVMLAGRRRTGQ